MKSIITQLENFNVLFKYLLNYYNYVYKKQFYNYRVI